jgi:hypothetical protein
MRHRRPLLTLLLLVALAPWLRAFPAHAAEHTIYEDAPGSGWQNFSWATVDLAAATPARGAASIAVTYGDTPPYQGLYLYHSDIATAPYSKLRFWLHGGTAGGQLIQVYVKSAVDGTDGPKVPVPPPPAGSWIEVTIPLEQLGAANTTIAGVTLQDRFGGAQPTFYVDDIALVEQVDPNGPTVSEGHVRPAAAPPDGITGVAVRARVADIQGLGDIAAVTVDASALGRGTLTLRDDGRSADGAAGDGLYGTVTSVAPGAAPGEQMLVAVARDQAGNRASLKIGTFTVLRPAGGRVPAGLPQRPAYGTNDWSTEPALDWQGASGVPWDYVYQYITYEWYTDGWGEAGETVQQADYVGRFTRYAWGKGYIPVISVYLMLAVPPATGEGAAQYAAKLQNPETVRSYLAALEEAARQARGPKPVIFHLEPDFYGFMQSYSRSPDRPGGVQPDDPTSIPVALPAELNAAGYNDTLAGLGQRMVDLVHEMAPNALVAPHASAWATGREPNAISGGEVATIAAETAAFMEAMGGDQADLLFVEWSDRDAGSGLRPWWDDTNTTLPRVSRAVLWKNALSAASGKRLILWQVPVGHVALNDTCGRYRDNRAAYAFGHPRDLYDSGTIAVLFGPGAECMTAPSSDGGVLRQQAATAYALPATPTGLTLEAASDFTATLRWDESSEQDLWGYRLRYESPGGGGAFVQLVGPATSAVLTIPRAGVWQISVASYDAMGNLSPESPALTVTTTNNAPGSVYVPLVLR